MWREREWEGDREIEMMKGRGKGENERHGEKEGSRRNKVKTISKWEERNFS